MPNFILPGDLSPCVRYRERDIVLPEWMINAKGMVTIPVNKLGMGDEVDRDRVEDLTVRTEAILVE